MINIINCSPKINSNSAYFINKIIKKLKMKHIVSKIYFETENDIFEKINKCNIVILVFPLYVDSPPSRLISIMEKYQNLNFKKIYVVCNCGFLESKHNDVAINIIKNWCFNNKGIFMGDFKIGAGEVIGKNNIISLLLSPLFNLKMCFFANSINKNKKIKLKTTILLPKKLFCYFANKNFIKKIN